MVTRAEYPDPDDYARALARWRRQENQRLWKIKNDENPIILIDEGVRVMPETFSFTEMFFHKLTCECGSCQGPIAKAVKQVRLDMRPVPPAVKSLVTHLPELPRQSLPLLRDAVERVRSKAG